MDTSQWEEGKAGTYVLSVLHEDAISEKIWQRCYLPYLKKYLARSSHVFYHAPYNKDIRAHLLRSGVPEDRLKEYKLEYTLMGGEYKTTNMPADVTFYPSRRISSRSTRTTFYPLLPDAVDKFALRCFDDAADFTNYNTRRYHCGDISNEERLQNIENYRSICIPLPSWHGYEPIKW